MKNRLKSNRSGLNGIPSICSIIIITGQNQQVVEKFNTSEAAGGRQESQGRNAWYIFCIGENLCLSVDWIIPTIS